MIEISNARVFNFEGAFRGLRNPLDSWALSDSEVIGVTKEFKLGPKDLGLAQRMIGAGTDESKFMRQIMVSVDIEAPLYWWKEFDTYKVGTVANSCSTMHKISSKEITDDMFSIDEEWADMPFPNPEAEDGSYTYKQAYESVIVACESLRKEYLRTKDKRIWRMLISILPCGWMQKRTVTLNYQVLRAMYFARKNHKLQEWRDFCAWIESLPYAKELICYEKPKPTFKNTYDSKVIEELAEYLLEYMKTKGLT